MGQVTLVIDNSDETIPLDYSEISIVRRVHRSGESEFFINGAPCRLRDIQQLLLGTGLGRGGMAVVGQGEIDAILSADPSERRLLIEETAGRAATRPKSGWRSSDCRGQGKIWPGCSTWRWNCRPGPTR